MKCTVCGTTAGCVIILLGIPSAALPGDGADAGARHAGGVSTEVVVAPGPVWKRHTIDATSRGADGVKLGDLNGDGRPDIVTGWEEGGVVRVYLNPGPAHARDEWPRVTVGRVANVEEAIFADLDGDGRLEVISGTEGKTRTVYRHRFTPVRTGNNAELLDPDNWRTEAFPATSGRQMWMQAAALDLDGQHGTDLLLASKSSDAAISWLRAPANPESLADWTLHPLRPAGWIMSLSPLDLDGDGDPDILFTDRKGPRRGAFWLENPGPEQNRAHAPWIEHPVGAAGREVMFADTGDVNGDGRIDVAIAVNPGEVVLCLRRADGRFEEQVLSLDRSNIGDAKAVKIADVNGDGLPDLFFTCENAAGPREGIVWLEQRAGQPWLQHPLGGPEGLKYDLMQVLDLDSDGDRDVITCEERDLLGVVWYENPHTP